MYTLPQHSHLIPFSELRASMSSIFDDLEGPLIVTRRGRPAVAVLPFAEYQQQQALLEELQDLQAGAIAQQRQQNTEDAAYLSPEQLKAMLPSTD